MVSIKVQFMMVCFQVNTLWGSFEIRNTRLAHTMMTQLACQRLEKHMEKFDEIADVMETLPLHFMAFHGQQPLKKVMEVSCVLLCIL